MDWFDVTCRYHTQTFDHECRLSSLPAEWQRELAAIWRLEADVNNGAYLQFLTNWGRESYVYASQALKKMGAYKMAEIIDRCQALVDEHFNIDEASKAEIDMLMPNPVIGRDGSIIKKAGSILPERILDRILELSYEFMDYPENITELGLRHYQSFVQSDDSEGPARPT